MTARAHHAILEDIDADVLAYDRAMGQHIVLARRSDSHHSEARSMQNVKMTVKGSLLLIEVNLKAKTTESKSGKSAVIASTQGNVSVPSLPDVKVGLNVYTNVK